MKCALVTGGSRGIGSAICQKLAEDSNYHILNFEILHLCTCIISLVNSNVNYRKTICGGKMHFLPSSNLLVLSEMTNLKGIIY